jgi:uroporphyrinogen III methyltransferase/synthase
MTMPMSQPPTDIAQSLRGKRILVTRSRQQASRFAALLRAYGAEPIEVPTIQIVPPSSWEPLDRAMADIQAYDWLLFTSVNGVRAFVERCALQGRALAELDRHRICAIGPATAQELQTHGIHVDVVPNEYRAESVVESLCTLPIEGSRILLPRAAVARDVLPRALTALGARVDVVEAYRTAIPIDGLPLEVGRLLAAGGVDVVTFTSSSTVTNFAHLVGKTDLSPLLRDVVVACIGPITADTARAYGMTPAVVAHEYTIPGLVQAMVDFFQRSPGVHSRGEGSSP